MRILAVKRELSQLRFTDCRIAGGNTRPRDMWKVISGIRSGAQAMEQALVFESTLEE